MILSLILGIVTGLICVGGIFWSLKLFYKVALDENMPPRVKRGILIRGLLIFVGQFVVAGLVAFTVEEVQNKPLPFILGLFSMNLGLPFLLRKEGDDSSSGPSV